MTVEPHQLGSSTSGGPGEGRYQSTIDEWILVVVALVLLLLWSILVPVFESPDEPHHWQFARYLHDERRLPTYGPDFVEANSPPLYYALAALIAAPSDVPPPLAWYDEQGVLVLPFPPRYFHNAGGDLQRYRPIRLARVLSVILSAFAVWCTYRCGLVLGGSSLALAAASIVAFLPQFTFRGGGVSNDTLVTTLAAATMWSAAHLVRRGFTWRVALLMAVCFAGAYLSKISAICLVGPVALAVIWSGGPLQKRVVRTVLVLSTAVVIVAPWSVRNVLLYGDPFASAAMYTAVSHIVATKPLTSPYFWTVFPSVLSRSFVGTFGWMNLWMPEGIYWAFWGLGLAGLAALAVQVCRRRADLRIVTIMAAAVVLNVGVVVHINRSFDQPQGRYLFPALSAIALLVAMGLAPILGSDRWRVAGARLLAAGLALTNTFILFTIVVPAYYPPVTANLWNESRQLASPTISGLEAGSTGELRLVHDDPQLSFSTTVDADRFGFLQFEVSGLSGHRDVQGSVYFAVEHQPGSELQQVPFRWRADGQRHRIRVSLLSNSQWNGTITTVRIDPVNAAVDRHIGETLRVEQVRLSDNLLAGSR